MYLSIELGIWVMVVMVEMEEKLSLIRPSRPPYCFGYIVFFLFFFFSISQKKKYQEENSEREKIIIIITQTHTLIYIDRAQKRTREREERTAN